MCFQNGQGELGTDLVVCFVKFRLFAPVHHVPHEVNPFDTGLARAYHLFVDNGGELNGTLHHHTVGDDGREDVVHFGNGLHHIGIVDGSRQVEEHEIKVGLRCHQIFGSLYRIFRTAASDGVRVLLQPFELLIRHHLVMPVLHDSFHVALAHVMDTVLWKIAVHHGYVVAFHIVQVACYKHRQGCLTRSTFLRGDCHISCFFHFFDNLFGYTSVRWR